LREIDKKKKEEKRTPTYKTSSIITTILILYWQKVMPLISHCCRNPKLVLAPSFSHGSRDQIDPLDMSIRGRSHLCRRCHLINLVLYRRRQTPTPCNQSSHGCCWKFTCPFQSVFLRLIVDRRDQVSWLLQDFRFRTCNRESDDSVSALPYLYLTRD
jgi:hypothetical protein